MAVFLFAPHFQVLDANGDPYSGAKLNFYQAGTTTPITVYTDSGVGTPLSNPVVADSSGAFAQVWLNETSDFKIVLTESDDTVIDTIDNIPPQDASSFSDGSVSAPGIFWTDDTNTGLYRIGTDNMAVTTGGTKAQEWDASQRSIFNAQVVWKKGSDIASATTLNLGSDGNSFDVTGTTTITAISSVGVGSWVALQFDGILQLTHSTDLVLPNSANITTRAGDVATFYEYATGDWRLMSYTGVYMPGGTDVAVADGGTGGSTAAAARTNLAVVGTADLASNSNGLGASLVGLEDSGTLITATDAEGAFAELATSIAAITSPLTLVSQASVGTGTTYSVTDIPSGKLIIVVYGVISHNNGSSRGLTLAVSSNNGSSYGTAHDIGDNIADANTITGISVVTNAGTSSTDKLIAGGYGSLPRGGYETSITGVIDAIQLAWNGAGSFDNGYVAVYVVN